MAPKKRSAPNNRKRERDSGHDGKTSSTTVARKPRSNMGKKKSGSRSDWSFLSAGQIITSFGILSVAIAMAVLWNWRDPIDPKVQSFLSRACSRKGGVKCAPSVTPTRRTFQAATNLRKGEKLAEIPKSLQIWDLDALRDDFIRDELFPARHARSGNTLSSGAYLAAYLALQVHNTTLQSNIAIGDYLSMLPTYDELKDHPILWDQNDLLPALMPHSSAFSLARFYRDMVQSEYNAFTEASVAFSNKINLTDYQAARINILTRTFSPGPMSMSGGRQGIREGFESWEDEERFYKEELNINFEDGCHVLVPILDMLNHHPKPNVAYHFDKSAENFVIVSTKQITTGWELMDSYGKHSDAHLYAKYGFINGDGSGYTLAGIALFHRNLDFDMKHEFSYLPMGEVPESIRQIQKRDLRHYLVYDDGYKECIEGPETHPEEFSLKKLQLEHLVQIANDNTRWFVNFPPRNTRSVPSETSNEPITLELPELDPRQSRVDYASLVATCRLMVLTTRDFDGKAAEILRTNLGNTSFVVETGNDALEYRSVMCLARLASTSLLQFKPDLREQMGPLKQLNRESFQMRNWTVAHIRYGEMQALQALSGIAFTTARKWEQEFVDKEAEAFNIREKNCPLKHSDALLLDSSTSPS